ncbi:ABC transporter ATP-binding protein [Aquamicrobium terrae]
MEFGAVMVLDEFSLDVGQGEFMTILGASGSGKSTLLGIISGLRQPTRGRILLDGADITGAPANRRNIGLVFQSYALFPTMNVFDNVAFPLKVRRRGRDEITREVGRALSLVRLDSYGARRIAELSGGQQQRVALARALVFNPSVLLLDEPLGALDRKLRQEVQGEIRDLQRQVGITTLLVTHDQEEALSLSDRIAIVNAGRLEQVGSPSELYSRPATAYVADFFGSSNIVTGRLHEEGGLRFLDDRGVRFLCEAAANGADAGERALSLRPESIRLDIEPAAHGVAAVVDQAIYLGTAVRYRLVLDNGRQLVAVVPSDQQQHPPATRVWLRWRPGDIWLIPQKPGSGNTAASGGASR